MPCVTRLSSFFFVCSLFVPVFPFSFSAGPSTQCGDLALSWKGGTGPFQLLMTPVFGTPRTVSIPSTAFSNGEGSYKTQLPFPQGQKFLLTMSDATGFGTGGSSGVLVTGVPQGTTCNTTDPGVDFSFELNSALQQCRPFVFSGYPGAIQPVTIMGIVPGGTSFVINPPIGEQYIWNADVAQETSIIFIMTDSRGRQGGSSDVRLVGNSDDKTCLNANSPSSTSASPSTDTSKPSSGVDSHNPSATPAAQQGPSIGAIIGIIIGALLFLAICITLGLFFLRRRRDGAGPSRRRVDSDVDLTYDPMDHSAHMTPYPAPSGNLYSDANPFNGSQAHVPTGVLVPSHQLQSPLVHPSQYQSQYQPSQYQPSQYQPSQYQPSQYQSSQYEPSEYQSPPPTHYQPHLAPGNSATPISPFGYPLASSQSDRGERPADQSTSRDSMSTTQRKVAIAGVSTYKPARFIMHTDVEDALPPTEQESVIELPPLYSERRGPVPGLAPPTGADPLQQPHQSGSTGPLYPSS